MARGWDAFLARPKEEMDPSGYGEGTQVNDLNWGTAGAPTYNKTWTSSDDGWLSELAPGSSSNEVQRGGKTYIRGHSPTTLAAGVGKNAWMIPYLVDDPEYGSLLPYELTQQLQSTSHKNFFDKGGGVALGMAAMGLGPMAVASAASQAPSFLNALGQGLGITPSGGASALSGAIPNAAQGISQNSAIQTAIQGTPWDLNVDSLVQNAMNQPIIPEVEGSLMNTLGTEGNSPWLNQYLDPSGSDVLNTYVEGQYGPLEYTGSGLDPGVEGYPEGPGYEGPGDIGDKPWQDYTSPDMGGDPYGANDIGDKPWVDYESPPQEGGQWWEKVPPLPPNSKNPGQFEDDPSFPMGQDGAGTGTGGVNGMIDSIAKALGLTSSQLGRLLGAVGGGIAGNMAGNKTQDVGQQKLALQTPYQQRFAEQSQNPAKWNPLDVNAMVDLAAERMGRKWSMTEGNPAESPKARISTERDIADLIYRAKFADQEKAMELDQAERQRTLAASGLTQANPLAGFDTTVAGQKQSSDAITGGIGSVIDTLFNPDRNKDSNKQIADLVAQYMALMRS